MKRIGEKGIAGTHIKHMEGCLSCIEIEFVRLGFHLNKVKSNGHEFNMYARGQNLEKKAPLGPTLYTWKAIHQA